MVSTPKRVADLPDVPTPVEIGLKDADSAIWFGVFVPAKTPREIVDKLHAAGEKVLADPAMQASLKKLGIEPMPMTPAEMDDLVKREIGGQSGADQGRGHQAVGEGCAPGGLRRGKRLARHGGQLFPPSPELPDMSLLFSPIELRGLRLANRIVVSPMCQYSAEDGRGLRTGT